MNHVDLVINCDGCPFSWMQKNEVFRCVHDFVTRPELKDKGFFFGETGRRIYAADEPSGGRWGRPKWCPLECGDVLVTIGRKPERTRCGEVGCPSHHCGCR